MLRYRPPSLSVLAWPAVRTCSAVLLILSSSAAMSSSGTFKYFAYGSNLLAQRIHLHNPTAVRSSVGFVTGWRLDFGEYYSKKWCGHVATIVPDENGIVWGAVWDVGVENLPDLDHQEGVDKGIYRVLENLPVMTTEGQIVKCRSYCLTKQPPIAGSEYLPSKLYLDTIIKGAKETGLPKDYVDKLEQTPHNGFSKAFNAVDLMSD